jgi:hypothetical protein
MKRRRGFPNARIVALAIAALTCACASTGGRERAGAPSAVTAQDGRALEDAERALAPAERELQAVSVQPTPDCARACTLASNVCALAERICSIAARYPATDPVADRCADGRARCQRARTSTATCACQSAR